MTEAPPGKTAKEKNAEKAAKEPKDPNAPAKPRAPRQDYGYKPGAVIALVEDHGKTYRGKRLTYYEILQKHGGKTVEDFDKACPQDDPPRGWLRFFVKDGVASLSGGRDPEPKTKEGEDGDQKAA